MYRPERSMRVQARMSPSVFGFMELAFDELGQVGGGPRG